MSLRCLVQIGVCGELFSRDYDWENYWKLDLRGFGGQVGFLDVWGGGVMSKGIEVRKSMVFEVGQNSV